jgi:N-acetylmuramoyl-L-alanine amidase
VSFANGCVSVLLVAAATGCGASQHTPAQPATTTAAPASQTVATTAQTTVTSTARRVPAKRPPPTARLPAAVKPPIVWDPIPFGPQRKAEMVAYAERHYALNTYKLIDPRVIVIHYTATPDYQSTYNTFAVDAPDVELHELPGTCAHFVIDSSGVIHQLVPLDIMCRHTVGLNWTAIGIEHVGDSDQQVLNDPRQITASVRLVRWLRCRFDIPVSNVIGHNESLKSPYHHENVAVLRTQTHSDFMYADMEVYRSRLRELGACPKI